jgi:hypothetical protein
MTMLKALIDQLIEYKPTAVILVLAHVGALLWALGPRGSIVPALALNLVMAAGILAYNAQGFGLVLANADWALMALAAFALANLLGSAAALYGLRIPAGIVWTIFGVDFALSVLLAAFLFLFKINRLF